MLSFRPLEIFIPRYFVILIFHLRHGVRLRHVHLRCGIRMRHIHLRRGIRLRRFHLGHGIRLRRFHLRFAVLNLGMYQRH